MNRSDGVACEHVLVKRKTGFGETSMRKAREWAEHQGVSVGSVLHELAAGAEHHGRKVLTGKAVQTAREVAEAADRIGAMMNRGTRPEQMLEEVLTLSGVEAQAKRMAAQSDEEKASAGRAQLDRLNELRAIATECPSVIELSDHLAISDLPEDGEERAAVTLSTVHGFKGAECDHVLLMGMEEDILPKAGVESAPEQMEEERRIFHVAVTRACHTLTLTCAMERNEVQTEPSRFIDEVAQHVMVVSQSKPRLPFRTATDKR